MTDQEIVKWARAKYGKRFVQNRPIWQLRCMWTNEVTEQRRRELEIDRCAVQLDFFDIKTKGDTNK